LRLAVAEPPVPPLAEPSTTPAPPAPEISAAVPRGPRKERMQPVTLRVSEALHAQLLYIADNGKRSMNQFIVDVLGPAVQVEVEKIQKRKALGLD
jgi:HicB family